MRARLLRLRRDDRGLSMIFVGLGCMAFVAASTLAIDVGMFMTAKTQAQNSADAGALAALGRSAARTHAVDVAEGLEGPSHEETNARAQVRRPDALPRVSSLPQWIDGATSVAFRQRQHGGVHRGVERLAVGNAGQGIGHGFLAHIGQRAAQFHHLLRGFLQFAFQRLGLAFHGAGVT